MNRAVNIAEGILFLEKITFHRVNILAAALSVLSLALLTSIKLHVISPRRLPAPAWTTFSPTPQFLIVYNLLVALGLGIIYATRNRNEYYRVRAYIYGMFLGGIVGELLHFFSKHLLHI